MRFTKMVMQAMQPLSKDAEAKPYSGLNTTQYNNCKFNPTFCDGVTFGEGEDAESLMSTALCLTHTAV